MFAVALRRFRLESIGLACGLAVIGVLALITGRMMSAEYHDSGLAECMATGTTSDCRELIDHFGEQFNELEILILPLIVLPALVGVFVGAPLVARELEAGSHRFLWTQGVTRRRWLANVAGVGLGLALAAGLLYTVITYFWLRIVNEVSDERFGDLYDFQGLLPIAAGVFAVAVGVAAGVMLRRTLPAMIATLGIFVAVRLVIAIVLRPRFAEPETMASAFRADDPLEGTGAWILSEQTVTADGRVLGENGMLNIGDLGRSCPKLAAASPRTPPSEDDVSECLNLLGVQKIVRYHPSDRYWTFQLIESGLLVGLAAAATAVAFGALRRRPA